MTDYEIQSREWWAQQWIFPAPSSDTILDVLGPIPLATGSHSASTQLVMQHLDAVYKAVSQQEACDYSCLSFIGSQLPNSASVRTVKRLSVRF